MCITKIKSLMAVLLAVGLVCGATGLGIFHSTVAVAQPEANPNEPKKPMAEGEKKPKDKQVEKKGLGKEEKVNETPNTEAAKEKDETNRLQELERVLLWMASKDRPRFEVQILLARVANAKPATSDRQLATALYWLTLDRPGTEKECLAVENSLRKAKDRVTALNELLKTLWNSPERKGKLSEIRVRLTELNQMLKALPQKEKLQVLNSEEALKFYQDVSGTVLAAMPGQTDRQLVEALFLLALSRFPTEQERDRIEKHLENQKNNRPQAAIDTVWTLVNTREFITGP